MTTKIGNDQIALTYFSRICAFGTAQPCSLLPIRVRHRSQAILAFGKPRQHNSDFCTCARSSALHRVK